jgi:hypothetical protein
VIGGNCVGNGLLFVCSATLAERMKRARSTTLRRALAPRSTHTPAEVAASLIWRVEAVC